MITETQAWTGFPGEWRIPCTFGFTKGRSIWHHHAERFHIESDCPYGVRS